MTRCALVVLLVALLGALGCGRDHAGHKPGTERGDCRTSEHDRCDPGLACLSNVCVRPPPADCKQVGETLASLDLGTDAQPAARAPLVAKYQAACEQARVSKDEGDCLAKANDKWSASQCAPRMFPELASSNSGDCKQVIAKLEGLMKTVVAGQDKPQMQRFVATTLRVMQQSCEQDAWPDALKQCILRIPSTGGTDALQGCNLQFPAALQSKLQERMQAAEQMP